MPGRGADRHDDERAFAARLSEEGAITTLWTSDDAPALAGRAFAFPMVAAGGGSVLFGYAELNAGARLEVIELGCAP